jgi:hypothetical protein
MYWPKRDTRFYYIITSDKAVSSYSPTNSSLSSAHVGSTRLQMLFNAKLIHLISPIPSKVSGYPRHFVVIANGSIFYIFRISS